MFLGGILYNIIRNIYQLVNLFIPIYDYITETIYMNKRLKFSLFLLVLVVLGFGALGSARPALADNTLLQSQEGFEAMESVLGGTPQDLRIIVARMINVVLSLLGVIFVVLIIFGGFQYMTSAGNEEKTQKAVGILKAAIIGLIIILAAWSITRYTIIVMNNTTHNAVDYTRYPNY